MLHAIMIFSRHDQQHKYDMIEFDICADQWDLFAAYRIPQHCYQVHWSQISINWDRIVITDPQWTSWILLQQDQWPWIISECTP